MKYLDDNYYVEVKDCRYKIHPNENNILRKRDPPTSLRTQYQVQNETKIRRNQKVIKKESDELIVKIHPQNRQPIIQQQKIKPSNCPSCKRNNWFEFNKGYYCKNCEYFINRQKHQIDKKNRGQDHYFSTRFPYANERKSEIWMNMVNTTYNSSEDMCDKSQSLKSKTQIKFYKNISNYYIDMKQKNFQTQEDLLLKTLKV